MDHKKALLMVHYVVGHRKELPRGGDDGTAVPIRSGDMHAAEERP